MRMLFTLIALLGTTATTMAQTPEIVAELESLLQKERQAVDVEVLRRLLNQRFGFADKVEMQLPPPKVWYSSTAEMNSFSSGSGDGVSGVGNRPPTATAIAIPGHQLSQSVGPFDGSVLPAGGIVYTLRIPAGADLTLDPKTNALGLGNWCSKCHADVALDGANQQLSHKGTAMTMACSKCHDGGSIGKDVKDAKPSGDWDRVKLEIAVEKVEELAKPQPKPTVPRSPMCRPGDLAEQIVQVLAANAKNLGAGQLPSKQLAKNDRVTVIVTFDELPRHSSGTLAPTSKPGFTSDELQSLNLGGLHFKQQKYKEAAEAFEKGLGRYQDGVIRVSAAAGTPHDTIVKELKESEAAVRGMYKQLAASQLQLGELDKAKKSLELATSLKIELYEAKSTEKPRPKLPAKIIVSALKADIDSAKTLDDFRKVATVERSGFPTPKK